MTVTEEISSQAADARSDDAPDSSAGAGGSGADAADGTAVTDTGSEAAPERKPTVDVEQVAQQIAVDLIDQTWGYRSPVERYGALWDRRAALLRAAKILEAEAADELLRLRRARLTLEAIARLITQRVRRVSEATVRAYIAAATARSAAAK